MRLPFLRPKPAAETVSPAAARADRARRPSGGVEDDIAAARVRARRRLIGALALLVVGVVGFPLLFETQPRPLPLDIPIQVPAADTRAPAAVPRAGRPLPVINLPADAGTEASADLSAGPGTAVPATAGAVAPPAAALAAAPEPRKPASVPAMTKAPAAQPTVPVTAAAKARSPAVAATAAPRPAAAPSRPGDGSRAAALLAGAAPTAAAAAGAGRYVVQVGAYTDAAMLSAARAKVEKLGLKTYTQVIAGDAGKRTRVRLGPFSTRAEADAAAAKLKGAGMPANVLAL